MNLPCTIVQKKTCIKYALEEGFEVHLGKDATRPLEQETFEKQLEELREKGFEIIASSELFK